MQHLITLLLLIATGCGGLDRSNPFDPVHRSTGGDRLSHSTVVPADAELLLYLPLGKALATVIYRIEAVLTGPNMLSISKTLDISPLGPATGTIGALQQGSGYILHLRGYDLDDELIFEGHEENITISNNDTTLVEIELTLLKPLPDFGDGTSENTEPDEGSVRNTVEKVAKAIGLSIIVAGLLMISGMVVLVFLIVNPCRVVSL